MAKKRNKKKKTLNPDNFKHVEKSPDVNIPGAFLTSKVTGRFRDCELEVNQKKLLWKENSKIN